MNKSLIMLLAFLALIVMLTTVVINTRTIKNTERGRNGTLNSNNQSITLSPYDRPEKIKPHTKSVKKVYSEKKEISSTLLSAYTDMDNNKVKDAENKVKTVLIFEPDNFNALSLLGRIYYNQQKYEEAEVVFRRQTRIQGTDAAVYNNLGQTLAKQQKFEEALKQMTTASELDPDSPLISLNLSGIYSVQGEKKKSIEYFKKAFEKLGNEIIPIAKDPTLDNIRQEQDFKDILEKASQQKQPPVKSETGKLPHE